MNGNWLRVTPDELEHARNDLDWAFDLAGTERDGNSGRWCGIDKAWNGLDFLLNRLGFETPLVFGAESFIELPDAEPDSDEMFDFLDDLEHDWGYGPPAYLTPPQVAAAASQLARITEDDLLRGVDPAELQRAEVYPGTWDRPGELAWVAHYLPDVRTFFSAAAKDGDAVICWLD
ncbi:YfbM family protein [Jidongwangia harbinensis]|uniref:YfbM family protein n=1 Tax=Jidongwangia harbinensis TaxID=2878561 RepID=UPI001CD92D91|nr:YfbM family protein [Jidongwangia harbinensis]MCA2216043.1 YfbM family protein [Jidongwangia harbinensis]